MRRRQDDLVERAEDTVWVAGIGVRFLLDGPSTGGALSIVEHLVPPGGWAGPMHTHQNEDEYSFVIEGTLGFRIGDQEVTAAPGSLVVKPRGVPHTFWNADDEPGRILEVISPGGFDQYFREVAPHLQGSEEPDLDALGRLWKAYGLTMHMESMAEIAAAHGLAMPGS